MVAARFERARQMHTRGVALYNSGQPARALAVLHRALDLLNADDSPSERERAALAARLWNSIALNEAELRSLEAGFAALETAQEYADQVRDPSLDVLLHIQRGLIELRGGSLTNSRRSLDAAVELIDYAGPDAQCSVLLNRGNVALVDGRLADARSDFQRSAGIAERARLDLAQYKSLHNLAYVEFLHGELSRALRLMGEAQDLGIGDDGIALLDRARVLIEAGLSTAADDALARASAMFRGHRVAQDLAETELERARCALALGDVRAARRFAGSARRRFLRRGADRWRRAAELVLLQADLADRRAGSRLVAAAEQLAAEFESEDLRLHAQAARLTAVEAGLSAGRADDAAEALREISPPLPDDPVTGRMHDHYVRARVAAASGDSSGASRRVRRALDELARYQASFGSIDLRTASAVHGRRLAELDVSLALRSGRPGSVFAAAERARAVSSRLPAVRPPDDPQAAALLAELRQTLESLRGVEQDRAASEPLLRKRRELERRIIARSWTLPGSGAVDKPASLERVRASLRASGRSMITFVQAGGALSAVVVGPRVRVIDLGGSAPVLEQVRRVRADMDVLAQPTLPPGMRDTVRSSLNRSLAELDDGLLSPLRVAEPVVIVSTGVLGQLPWASLGSLRGRSIVVAPSATKWLASTERSHSGRHRVTAVVGPGLGRGGQEAAAVGAAWQTAHVDHSATTATLIEAVGSASVLHVAAHGVHQPENPLFSSLRMVDGPVFAHELDQRGQAPEHVVLSACEVGLATIRPGDEALGLASVLLNLGTRSVIAGLARVGDEIAAETMAVYHAKLAAGADSADALAAALAEIDTDVVPPFVNFGAAWSAGDLAAASGVA